MKDLVIPLGLLAVMGSMLLPVPPTALDFLLVGNLVLALVLFVSSLYVSDSLKLSSLPALLLIATLYRLGLNVATTRAILSNGNAGQVVHAFGETVIAGNLVVGIVVFLILTLIQFIVIAKGAERVAEVAARFTLDALPGKQMSVDADVRAGLIDFETARRRRNEMQTESRFFGALDGAMKFVKGDAIAGLCMVAVNIAGGLMVGVFMEGLALSQALQHYTLLTIGDGLVSQIPALLNALAAGMVVTRVSRGDDQSLAHEVLTQLGQVRSAKILIGILIGLLGILPGMPALPFLSLSLFLLIAGMLPPQQKSAPIASDEYKFEPRVPAVILIELGTAVAQQLQGSRELLPKVQEFRKRAHRRTGLVLALPEFETNAAKSSEFVIKLRGIPITQGLQGETPTQTLAAIFELLDSIVERRTVDFIDDILTRRMLDSLEREAPELVSAVVPNVVTVTQITEVLRALAREAVSIKSFDIIMQAIAEHGSKAGSERILLEEVRIAMRHVISYGLVEQHAPGTQTIPVIILEPVYDLALNQTERENKPLDVQIISEIIDWVSSNNAASKVLLVSRASRRVLSECFRARQFHMPVIALEEIAEGYELDVQGRIEARDPNFHQEVVTRLAA